MINIYPGVFLTLDTNELLLMANCTSEFIIAYNKNELNDAQLSTAIDNAIDNYNEDKMYCNIFSIEQRNGAYDIVINETHLERLNDDADRFDGADDKVTLYGEIMDFTYDSLNIQQQYS